MPKDKCKELRQEYDKCFQEFLDNVYFKQPVKGPFVPCKEKLDVYHECLKTDTDFEGLKAWEEMRKKVGEK